MTELMNRDEFKAWWLHDDQRELRLSCAEGWGRYIWKASRAAIEVELPSRLTQDGRSICIDKDGEFLEYCDVVGAIKSLGLKVKP